MNKTIEYLNPLDYCRYSIVPFPDANRVEFTIENDSILGEDIDFFNLDNKTIICFKNENTFMGFHNFKISSEENSIIVQSGGYHHLKNIIELQSIYPTKLFSFNDSRAIVSQNSDSQSAPLKSATTGEPIDRCDINKMGPFPFYPRLLTYNITNVHMLISLTGTAHLVALESNDENIQFPAAQGINTVTHTLAGAIKNIYEWKQVSEEPFNNQEAIAKAAKKFIDDLGLNEIAEEISSRQTPMRVARYLQGETVANLDFNEEDFITENLKKYLLKNIMYLTLNSLQKNYPEQLNIPQNILDIEKNSLEQDIYEYCLENSLDPAIVTIEEIYNDIIRKEKYNNLQNSFYPSNRFMKSITKYYHM